MSAGRVWAALPVLLACAAAGAGLAPAELGAGMAPTELGAGMAPAELGAGLAPAELAALAPFARGATYSAAASVLLGERDETGARGGELGYRLRAALAVQPLWAQAQDVLLHFTLESPQLMLRGKHLNAEFVPRPSVWDEVPSSTFLALWSAGRITAAYLDPQDPPDILNFKKALISLFQFQMAESAHNETDVSGECSVQYERVSELVFRKYKNRCLWEGSWDGVAEDGTGAERRRVVRYEADAARGALVAAAADEVVRLRGADPAAPLRARALLSLTLRDEPPAPPRARVAGLAAALNQAPALAAHALPLRAAGRAPDDEQSESLESAVAANRAAFSEEAAGSARAAAATLRLLPALRRAPAHALAPLLAAAPHDELSGLVRALGLAGAGGAHAACVAALELGAREPARPELAREYYAALALAPAAEPAVLRDVLRLARAGPLAPAALLAAAAAAATHPALQLEVKDHLLKGLARCKDEECVAARLLALGQLRRVDTADLLVRHAAGSSRRAALAALAALALGPLAGYSGPRRRRLERVALALDAPHALEVRAAALDLALLAAADYPAALRPLAAGLRRAPRELRRVFWQRLQRLAGDRAELRDHLRALDPRPADWLRRAHDGTSSLLTRDAGWARLDSAQLAARGVLRRGAVALSAAGAPLLTVELWTRGMESLAGAERPPPRAAREPEDELPVEDEELEGGLALVVGGARQPDRVLFSGQGELLGHVWAGTGSAPTPVLRAVLPRAPVLVAAPLLAGALLVAQARAAAALAMDAQAQVSLWGRTARGGLALRGAGVELSSLRLRTAWSNATARAETGLEPALALDISLDFYDKPQLCVRTAAADYQYSRNVTLEALGGDRRWRVRRERVTSRAAPGRSLALGAPNDAACAALGAAHLE